MEDPVTPTRVKFYGAQDLATGWEAERAATLVQEYGAGRKTRSVNDALELHNALAFEENGILPSPLDEQGRASLASSVRESRREVASFFSGMDASNVESLLADLEFQYAEDLIFLIERYGVAKRVGGQVLFEALLAVRVPLAVMLSNHKFVKRYDRQLRIELLNDPRNGQLLVSKRLIKNAGYPFHLPESFLGEDSQQLLLAYIDSPSPHPNHIQAIAQANDNSAFGLTPKIRLHAKKRYESLMHELFAEENNSLMKNGYGVEISPEQHDAVVDKIDRTEGGMTHIRSFSERYLSSSMAPARVLKNFASMIGYLDRQGLLTTPAFQAQIGTIEGLLISGKESYPGGNAFNYLDSLTLLGTHLYSDFLHRNGVEAEDAVAWFFREHLVNEYGVTNFYYAPSSPESSFLERCRHITAEMESIVKQFTLYCEEGELDPELLRMTSGSRPWGEIPSLVRHKYLQPNSNSDCNQALNLLFGDQSRLTYVNPELRAASFVELVTENDLLYESLHHYQKGAVDWLASEGMVAVENGVLEFAQPTQVLVLSDIYEREAAAYGRYGADESAAALALVKKGWLNFRSTLLTSAESSYFNFFLNKSEFSDGPDLRNRYAHGTNADPGDVSAHRKSYGQLLRMLVSLVLKILDDFQVSELNCSPPSC